MFQNIIKSGLISIRIYFSTPFSDNIHTATHSTTTPFGHNPLFFTGTFAGNNQTLVTPIDL